MRKEKMSRPSLSKTFHERIMPTKATTHSLNGKLPSQAI